MAAKNEGSSSSSSADHEDSRQQMEAILSQFNYYAGRYQRGTTTLLDKIKEGEKAKWDLIDPLEEHKKQLNRHLDRFSQFIRKPKINQQETVVEKKIVWVKVVLSMIQKMIEILKDYKKKYEEATRGRLKEHEQEMVRVENKLRGIISASQNSLNS